MITNRNLDGQAAGSQDLARSARPSPIHAISGKMPCASLGLSLATLLFFSTLGAVPLNPRDMRARFSGTTNGLTAVCSGGGTIVAIGKNGTILTSSDTVTWSARSSGTANDLNGIAYGNGVFAVVEGTSGDETLSSPDGVAWSRQSLGAAAALRAVTFGQGRFVAVGEQGAIWTSTDGVSWSNRPTGVASTLKAVTFGNIFRNGTHPLFVAVGERGALLTSSDGLAWTFRDSGTLLDLNSVASVDTRNGVLANFIALGAAGTAVSSSDGVNWTAVFVPTEQDIFAAAGAGAFGNFAGGVFALAGQNGSFFTSDDGVVWKVQDAATTNNLRGVVHVDGEFLGVGDAGVIRCGFAWIRRTPPTTAHLLSATYGNGKHVVVGSGGTVLTSTDGVDWSGSIAGNETLYSVTYGAGRFVAVGDGLSVLVSTDGVSWATTSLPPLPGAAPPGSVFNPQPLQKVAYGNGSFIASGYYYVAAYPYPRPKDLIVISPDGVNWTVRTNLPLGYNVAGGGIGVTVSAGPDIFLLSGADLSSSTDGVSWTPRLLGTYFPLVLFGSNSFVGLSRFDNAGYAQIAITSSDGLTWYSNTPSYTVPCDGISYGDGSFLAVGSANGTSLFSASVDGSNWTSGVFFEQGVKSATFDGNSFVAVGASGLILQSIPDRLPVQLQMTKSAEGMDLVVVGDPGKTVDLQESNNLLDWNHWLTVTLSSGRTNVPVPATGKERLFLRARSD